MTTTPEVAPGVVPGGRSPGTSPGATGLLLVLLLSGCGGPPLLAEIVPVSARLEGDKRIDVGMIGSVGLGGGTMIINDIDGASFRVPVSTHGVGLGAMLEMSGSEGVLEIDLSSGDVLRATDLFTHYEGSRGEIVLAIGASYLELESEFGARMSGWLLGFGTSIWAGHQWIFIEPAGDVVERPAQELAPTE
jgi:hypothetical protein